MCSELGVNHLPFIGTPGMKRAHQRILCDGRTFLAHDFMIVLESLVPKEHGLGHMSSFELVPGISEGIF